MRPDRDARRAEWPNSLKSLVSSRPVLPVPPVIKTIIICHQERVNVDGSSLSWTRMSLVTRHAFGKTLYASTEALYTQISS